MQNIFKKIIQTKEKYNSSIVFDSRLVKKNDIFIGLKSNNRDGNLFALDAIKKGAIFAIVDNNKLEHENIIYTKSVQSFIKKFIKFLLGAYKGKIVAISGSVCKTTTKENIYHILNNNQFTTYRSFKNINNILGLQFSIMNINFYNKYSIFELGINNPGEMKILVKILNPHYCLITGIENSHIGNFKNFNNLIDNKLDIFDSSKLIKGVLNFRHKNIDISKKINSKIIHVNIDEINKKVIKNKKFKIDYFLKNRKYSIKSDLEGIYTETAILTSIFLKSFMSINKIDNFFIFIYT